MSRKVKVGNQDLYFWGEKLSKKRSVKVGKVGCMPETSVRLGFDPVNKEDLIEVQHVTLNGSLSFMETMSEIVLMDDVEEQILHISEELCRAIINDMGLEYKLRYGKIGFKVFVLSAKDPVIDVIIEHKPSLIRKLVGKLGGEIRLEASLG